MTRLFMDIKGLEYDLAEARREMAKIDREIAELSERRALIVKFADSAEALIDAAREKMPRGAATASSSVASSAGPLPTASHGAQVARPPEGGRQGRPRLRPSASVPLSERRRFWRRVTDEAVAIISEEGRPLTAAEIYYRHSLRSELTPEEIYDTLYKRSSRGRLVRSLGGEFELI